MGKPKPKYEIYNASFQAGIRCETSDQAAEFLSGAASSTVWWVHVHLSDRLSLKSKVGGTNLTISYKGRKTELELTDDKITSLGMTVTRRNNRVIESLCLPMQIGSYIQYDVEVFPGTPCVYRVGIGNVLGKTKHVIEGLIDKIDELTQERFFARIAQPASSA